MRDNFWRDLPLEQLTPEEWEALCDRCNLCCHHRLLDETTGRLHYQGGCCDYLDHQKGGCSDYANRSQNVPVCTPLTLERLKDPRWLPTTCAYRLRAEGRDLYPWHPLNMRIVYFKVVD